MTTSSRSWSTARATSTDDRHRRQLHAEILEKLVSDHGATGPLVTDAVLAALAMEQGALLASTDQDFRRFPELRWLNPLRI